MARHNPKRSASDFQLRQQWIKAIYQYRQYEKSTRYDFNNQHSDTKVAPESCFIQIKLQESDGKTASKNLPPYTLQDASR